MAQASEPRSRQWHAAILGGLAVAHPDHQAVGVDVRRLEAEALAEPQPERVDGAERHAADGVPDAGEQRANLFGAEHRGQIPGLVDPEQLEHRPIAAERVGAEETQRADGDVDAGRRLLLLLAQEQKVGAYVLLGELSRLGLGPVEKEPCRELVALAGGSRASPYRRACARASFPK